MQKFHALLTLALLACPACALEDDDDDAIDLRAIEGTGIGGGTVFNTNIIESVAFSEILQPMGAQHHGNWLAELKLQDDTVVDQFLIDDGRIVAVDLEGDEHPGAALVGSTWNIFQKFKSPGIILQIVSFTEVGGIPYYHFQHRVWDDWIDWTDNCPAQPVDGVQKPGLARMLGGFTLDQGTGDITRKDGMTFIACTTGAVGKAVTWGYYDFGVELLRASALWPPVEGTEPISPLKFGPVLEVDAQFDITDGKHPIDPADAFEPLELAIRVVRADYCYDGKSHTKPGLPLLVEDVWKIRDPDTGSIEAVWGADGLICAGTSRSDFVFTGGCPGQKILPCDPNAQLADYPDGLIMTRLSELGLDDEQP